MSKALIRRTRPAFTLAELIIVMMIIVLLLSILLPALNSARQRAKKVAGQAQIANIASACESYMLAFNAAPGYCADSLFDGTRTRYFTGTENLVLSLLGGVVNVTTGWLPPGGDWTSASAFGTGTTTNRSIDFTKIGTGPTGKDGRAYGAFYSPKPGELVAVDVDTAVDSWWPDNAMPDLVDPGTGVPILYFRALQNSGRPVSRYPGTSGDDAVARYLRGQAHVYTAMVIITGAGTFNQRADSLISPIAPGSNTLANDNLAWFAISQQTSVTSNGPNGTDDVVKGSFFLHSAGPDGIYAARSQAAGATILATEVGGFDDVSASGG